MKSLFSAALGGARALLALCLVSCADPPPQDPPPAEIAKQMVQVYGNAHPCFMDTLGNIPIKVIDGALLIPAAVNGVPTIGVLDTGAYQTFITPELAAAAKVTAAAKSRARGVTGAFSFNEGSAARIDVGDLVLKNAAHVGIYPFASSNGTRLGIDIGADFLRGLDYDIDFVHETIRVYRLSNCTELDPPWPDTAARLGLIVGQRTTYGKFCGFSCAIGLGPLVALPVRFFPNPDLYALFDTGSGTSLMSFQGALDAGATRAGLDADPPHVITGITGEQETGKLHRFPQLIIGRTQINDASIPVRMQFDRRDLSMIMGMDLISRYHIWLSYRTWSIFIDTNVKRAPVAPLDRPHMVGATTLPIYPRDGNDVTAEMDVACWVEIDGNLTGCEVSKNTAGRNFVDKVLEWLTGPSHPYVQPAYQNGQPVRQRHGWHVRLAPPD